MGKKELIIFDMDGTLIDSGNVISNTVNFVRGHLGLPIMDKNELLANMNNPDINSAEFFYGTKKFTEEQTELFSEYYNKHCVSDIILYEGIGQMLEEISEYFTLSVATNASVGFANKMLAHLGIERYFKMVIGADCVDNPKPHPDMLLKTMESLNKEKHHSILVGDSHKDTRAAKAASIEYLLVEWGFTDHTGYNSTHKAISKTHELKDKLLELK